MLTNNVRDDDFINNYIPKVSRTFALTIKYLPKQLRKTVYISYLLCRVADTLEDSPFLKPEEKKKRLSKLSVILKDAYSGKAVDLSSIASLNSVSENHNDYDHKLLNDSNILFSLLQKLPKQQQAIIYKWVSEMAGGMARFTELMVTGDDKIMIIRNFSDWNKYCYYVAGTVGRMLTDLFIDHYKIPDDKAEQMIKLSESFGLGLQKVNVIKDVPIDRGRNVCYLPFDVMSEYSLKPSHMRNGDNADNIQKYIFFLVKSTISHLDDAIAYTSLFSTRWKGLRTFLVVPVFFAMGTLKKICLNPVQTVTGPPVKISRMDVTKLISAAALKIGSSRLITEYYSKTRNDISKLTLR